MFVRPFSLALGFLTHIPLLHKVEKFSEKDLGYSVLTYPLVGALLGLLLLFEYYFLPAKDLDLDAAIILITWNLLTGGLHLDGLSDSADAWIGGHHNRDRALEIMQDSHCGPIGVMVMISVLILKFAALKTLFAHNIIAMPLIFTPILSRAAVMILLLTTKYLRPQELGAILQNNLPQKAAIIIAILPCLFLVLLMRGKGIAIILVALFSGYILRKLMLRRIGGMTGDTAGAFIEILEVIILASFAL